MALKSEVAEAVQKVVALLEKQSGKKVKAVRSDRGGEYVNAELKKFFASNSIRHETIAPYTPQ